MAEMFEKQIVIERCIGSAVCIPCGIGLKDGLRNFQRHCGDKHGLKFQESKIIYDNIWSKYEPMHDNYIRDKYLSTTVGTEIIRLPRIHSLPVFSLKKCPLCAFLSTSVKVIANHIKRHHGNDMIDTSCMDSYIGQSFHSRKDWRVYWVIDDQVSEGPSQEETEDDEELEAMMKSVSTNEHEANSTFQIEKNSIHRSVFANLTKLDMKLERMGISWQTALSMTRTNADNDIVLFSELFDALKIIHNNFFLYCRKLAQEDLVWKHPERVMRIISMPGVSRKTKVFKFHDVPSEDNYRRRSFALILFAVRAWCLKAKKDGRLEKMVLDENVKCRMKELIREAKRIVENEVDESHPGDGTLQQNERPMQFPENTDENKHSKKKSYSCTNEENNTRKSLLNSKLENHAQLIMNCIQTIMYEEDSLSNSSHPSLLNAFTACLGIVQFRGCSEQLALGKHISHTIVSVGYLASLSAYLSISRFPTNGDSEAQLKIIQERHEPNGNLALHIMQELLAKTVMTRRVEESHGSWRRCTDTSHQGCGYVYGKHVSAKDVGNCIKKMQEEFVDKIFSSSGLFTNQTLPLELISQIDKLEDDIQNDEAGYYFMLHPRNVSVVERCRTFVKESFRKFLAENGKGTIGKKKEAMSMLKKVNTLSVLLQAMLQLSGGAPGRGREVCWQRIRNTTVGGRRACFLTNQDMMMIPGYSKTTAIAVNANLVSRHPDHVSTFLFKLFWLFVDPFRRGIMKYLNDNGEKELEKNCSYDYIIMEENVRLEGAKYMAREWSEYGLNLSHMEYRQWHGGYAKEKSKMSQLYDIQMQRFEEIEGGKLDNETICHGLQLQAGHCQKTAQIHYGRDANGLATNGCLDEVIIEKFREVCNIWHEDTGLKYRTPFSCKIFHNILQAEKLKPSSIMINKNNDAKSIVEEAAHPSDQLQPIVSGHKNILSSGSGFKRVEHHHPDGNLLHRTKDRRLTVEVSKGRAIQRGSMKRAFDWNLYKLESSMKRKKVINTDIVEKESIDSEGLECTQETNISTLPSENFEVTHSPTRKENVEARIVEQRCVLVDEEEGMIEKVLQCALERKDVTFKSETQRASMKQIMKREKDVLVIDRTGGGKTALISGPVLMENGVSIVIIPLRALQRGLYEKLSKLKITVRYIRDNQFWENIPRNGVIIASPEDVSTKTYSDTFAHLMATGRLLRVYVDEVHEYVLSATYRNCMKSIWKVRLDNRVQLVLLSATVPPSMVHEIYNHFRLQESSIVCIRGDLRRANVGITVERLCKDSKEYLYVVVCMKLEKLIERSTVSGRYIIATLTKADTDIIYAMLSNQSWKDCVIIRRYHSSINASEGKELLDEWCNKKLKVGEHLVMVATEGFGVGIDAELVHNVIIAGSCRSLFNFCQVLGRCGRNNERGRCYVLYHKIHSHRCGGYSEDNMSKQKEFDEFIQSVGVCLKLTLENYMGSCSPRVPCLERPEDVEKCSNCCRNSSLISNVRQEEEEKQKYWKKLLCAAQLVHGINFSEVDNAQTENGSKKLAEFRDIAMQVMGYCVPCCFETGKLQVNDRCRLNSGKHGRSCQSWRCLRCMGWGHNVANCTNMESITPISSRKACRWCFLQTVSGNYIHVEGKGVGNRNEYGSRLNCPFQNLVSMGFLCWTIPSVRKELVDEGIVRDGITITSTQREWCKWLTEDSFSSPAGIIYFSTFVKKHLT